MSTTMVLVATWGDGLFVVTDGSIEHEQAGQQVSSITLDRHGGVLAIVGGKSLCHRSPHGKWRTIAVSDAEFACCVSVGEEIFVGTNDAHVLRVDASDRLEPLPGFGTVAGRDSWYAGTAIIDGRVLGPPLGIRSMAATCDKRVLLANVHVGGIPRSSDGGSSWQPTINIDWDVHQVCTHPTRPDFAIAATGAGLGISKDAGKTWNLEQRGLHATYCSAVAFDGDDVLVAASVDHFAAQGAVYRRSIYEDGPLTPIGSGLPQWLDGIADTGCIAVGATGSALVDRGGNLYVSDGNRLWTRRTTGLPTPSSALIC